MKKYNPNSIILSQERKIDLDSPPFFIAEIGINHNGEFNRAVELIKIAKKCGADAVKFQKRDYLKTISPKLLNSNYEHGHSFGTTYGDHKKYLEFSDEELIRLSEIAEQEDIFYSCSAFDIDSYDFIEEYTNPKFHKIPSPLTVNHELLMHVANYGKPMFISTGMTTEDEIDALVEILKPVNSQLVILQCTSLYPTEDSEVNLNVIKTFQSKYNLLTGFSSHDRSVIFPAVAVGLGARVIEKHITQDRTLPGPDHASSFEPRGLELACKYIINTYAALGDNNKSVLEREKPNREKHFQSIVASRPILRGERLDRSMLTYKSPGQGLLPNQIDSVIRKLVKRDIEKDAIITLMDLEIE